MSPYVAVTANMIVCAVYTTIVTMRLVFISSLSCYILPVLFLHKKGGFKAVLWTDTFQFAIMIVSIFAVLFKGNYNVGGFTSVLNASLSTGRIELFE